MSFLYPLGLLGLIAIPILIIIYIIKNKYTEQVISATYLWTLSERFLKRKNPITRITGILSLILQILAVILISFSIAHPTFNLIGAADDYIFILDGSGSMHAIYEGESQIERGKKEIGSVISASAEGSSYTLIVTDDTVNIVYKNIEDKTLALNLLNETKASYSKSNITEALEIAQEAFAVAPSSEIYLITDKTVEETDNISKVITLSAAPENYALSDTEYTVSQNKIVFEGKAWSYASDCELSVALYMNDETNPIQTANVTVTAGQAENFSLEYISSLPQATFTSAKIAILNEDDLMLDNESTLFYLKSEALYQTLVVSDKPLLIKSALTALGAQVEVTSTEKYSSMQTGYGLYVFDGFTPEYLPEDGAVWFLNPDKNVENSGFTVQPDKIELPESSPVKLAYSTSTSTRVQSLLKGTIGSEIYLSKYVKCNFYRNFHTLLSVKGSPAVFAGSNEFGNREVVFAFSLNDSDITVQFDFIPLLSNLFSYTFPEILEESTFVCGDVVEVNVLPNSDSIRIESPSGEIDYLDVNNDIATYSVIEVGTHTLKLQIGNTVRELHFYGELPMEERTTSETPLSFVILGEKSEQNRDGKYDDLLIIFIILAVIFIADWVVYCYEQYQLR